MNEILVDPSAWTPELAEFTAQVFDSLATNWVDERGSYRSAPLVDALDRGHPPVHGRCLKIGSGTGLLTSYIREIWDDLVCVDLSFGMMLHHDHASQALADANRLPSSDGVFNVIVIGDGPLFVDEMVRLMCPYATLIWSNALGQGAPYYLKTGDIFDALTTSAPDSSWSAIESEALWGSWAVFRRQLASH